MFDTMKLNCEFLFPALRHLEINSNLEINSSNKIGNTRSKRFLSVIE